MGKNRTAASKIYIKNEKYSYIDFYFQIAGTVSSDIKLKYTSRHFRVYA